MFIKIKNIIINTDNVTSINEVEGTNNKIDIHLVNGKNVSFFDMNINQIEGLLRKVDKNEEKPNRLEILDL